MLKELCPYKRFNKHFKEFIRELMKTYPHVTEYKVMLAGYKITKTISKKLPFKIWTDVINEDMRVVIVNKDPSKILDPNFNVSEYEYVINMMRREWPNMNTHSQEMVWQHMNVLMILADDCPCK